MLVRTWNLFHGNSVPPGRTAYLEQMVRLAAADRPDVLLLQELPLWAFAELEAWSGMQAFTQVAHRTPLGATLGGKITQLNPGLLRSAVSGQGNAILLDRSLEAFDYHALVLNPRGFRTTPALSAWQAQLAWAKERRMLAGRSRATSGRPSDARRQPPRDVLPPEPGLADARAPACADFFLALTQPEEIEVLRRRLQPARRDALGFFASAGFSAPGRG